MIFSMFQHPFSARSADDQQFISRGKKPCAIKKADSANGFCQWCPSLALSSPGQFFQAIFPYGEKVPNVTKGRAHEMLEAG
jgi:hypothetical protein